MLNFKDMLIQVLRKISKNETGQTIPEERLEHLFSTIEDTELGELYVLENLSEESQRFLQEDSVEDIAHYIRMFVVTFIEIVDNFHPSVLKREIPNLREYHKIICSSKSDILGKAIGYAKKDMFHSKFKILENQCEHKAFFDRYTFNVLSFDLNAEFAGLLPQMAAKYTSYWESQICSLKRKNAIVNRRKYLIEQISELLSLIAEFKSETSNSILKEYCKFNMSALDKLGCNSEESK